MIIASHYVIRDIYNILEREGPVKGRKIIEKFIARYTNDQELKGIYDKYREYLISEDPEKLEDIKKDLMNLINIRQCESHGGSRLWFESRR